jgi:nicotinamidase-related amidase
MELGYSITLVKDATAAFSKEYMHAAIELTGPLYANAVLATDELVAGLASAAESAVGEH